MASGIIYGKDRATVSWVHREGIRKFRVHPCIKCANIALKWFRGSYFRHACFVTYFNKMITIVQRKLTKRDIPYNHSDLWMDILIPGSASIFDLDPISGLASDPDSILRPD
jgi:hypothetical protein